MSVVALPEDPELSPDISSTTDDSLSEQFLREFLGTLQPWVLSDNQDLSLEALKAVSKLSLDECHHDTLMSCGWIETLAQTIQAAHISVCAKRNAMQALANLSMSHSCQAAIVAAGVLSTVFTLTSVDGDYQLSELRRASARLLSNLSARFASRIVAAVGPDSVNNWVQRVDRLGDSRLRVHVDLAKDYLVAAV